MKAIGGFGIVLALAIMAYWFSLSAGGEDTGVDLPIAYGNVAGGQVDMDVLLGVVMAHRTRQKDPPNAQRTADEWVRDHFVLTDSRGQKVPFARQSSSKLIKAHEVQQLVGTEEFFLAAKLKVGESYTFDYMLDPQGRPYRYRFTAPAKAEKVRTCRFEATGGK